MSTDKKYREKTKTTSHNNINYPPRTNKIILNFGLLYKSEVVQLSPVIVKIYFDLTNTGCTQATAPLDAATFARTYFVLLWSS